MLAEIFNNAFWYMAPILVAMTTTLAGAINNKFVNKSEWKQVVAWIVATVLSCGSIVLGFLGEDIGWPSYVALSVVVGLSSNGFYDIDFIHEWIDSWKKQKPVPLND